VKINKTRAKAARTTAIKVQ